MITEYLPRLPGRQIFRDHAQARREREEELVSAWAAYALEPHGEPGDFAGGQADRREAGEAPRN
jgi:hypothetical protein